MSQTLCRLCLNTDRLINVFDARLRNGEQLRMDILLCTGVDIQPTDLVSKYVCHNCCIIAIKVFKYRKTTIANDKALKEWIGDSKENPISNTEDILKLHNSILKRVSQVQNVNESPELSENNVKSSQKSCQSEGEAAVHWTIIELFKRSPNIVVPNDVLKANIKPMLALEKINPSEFITRTSAANEKTDEKISDFELFRRKFPTINIVKVTKSPNETACSLPPKMDTIGTIRTSDITNEPARKSSSISGSVSKVNVLNKGTETGFKTAVMREASVYNKKPNISTDGEDNAFVGGACDMDDSDGGSINAADDYVPSVASSECSDNIASTSKTLVIKGEVAGDGSNKLVEENMLTPLEHSEIPLGKKKTFAKVDGVDGYSYNSVEKSSRIHLSSERSEVIPPTKNRPFTESDFDAYRPVGDNRRSRSSSEHSEIIPIAKRRPVFRDDSDGECNDENNRSRSSSARSEVIPSRKKRPLATDDDSDGDSHKTVGGKRRKRLISEQLEVIPPSKKRVFTKESRALHKIELPAKQPPDIESKKTLFTSSLELTKNISDSLPSPIEDVLVPLRETLELHCYHCDKTYHMLSHLNRHIQKHRKCIVCNKMHPSDAVLYDHLRKVCYKTVVANQPTLQLERIDENNSIVEKYKETFDFHLKPPYGEVRDNKPSKNTLAELLEGFASSDTNIPNTDVLCISDDDDDVLIIEDLSAKFNKTPNGDTIENELAFIKSIFRKYRNVVSKSLSQKSKKVATSSQTERPENCVKYCNDNQIILENMFGDLAIYKVPLDMLVSQKVSAHITYEPKEKEKHSVFKWSTGNVINLKNKRKISTNKNDGAIAKIANININDKPFRYVIPRANDISPTTQNAVSSRPITNSLVPPILTQNSVLQYATQSVMNSPLPAITQNTLISQHINNNIVVANATPAISQTNVSHFANQNILINPVVTQNMSQVTNQNVLISTVPPIPQNNLISQTVMDSIAGNNISQFSSPIMTTSNTQNALTYTLSQYANQSVSVANFTVPQSNTATQESFIMTGTQAYNATIIQSLLDANVGTQQTNQSYIVPTTNEMCPTFNASKAITDVPPLIILATSSVPTTVSNSSPINSVPNIEITTEKSLIRVKAPWELNQSDIN